MQGLKNGTADENPREHEAMALCDGLVREINNSRAGSSFDKGRIVGNTGGQTGGDKGAKTEKTAIEKAMEREERVTEEGGEGADTRSDVWSACILTAVRQVSDACCILMILKRVHFSG